MHQSLDKSKDTPKLGQHHFLQVYTKWNDNLKPNSSIQSRICKSSKFFNGIWPQQGLLKLSRTWDIFTPLLAKSMEGKSRTSDVVNKYHKQASSISSFQHQQVSKFNLPSHKKTWKLSQGHDKTLKELLKDLDARNLSKSPRLL